MNVLVVGGTGLIGGEAALQLRNAGHTVTLMSRKPPACRALTAFEFVAGDYVKDDVSHGELAGFDALVFAAAADIRQLPLDGSIAPEDFYYATNTVAVPRFFAAAKAAGISRAVYIGSFYSMVAPERVDICPYVRSRHAADTAVRALGDSTFSVCSLNAPFVLGYLPGLEVPHLDALVDYARGRIPGLPVFAPRGGTNHITSRSLGEAIANALDHGENGRAYLVGDENYPWKDYLELWFAAAGNSTELEVRDEDHPMLPDAIMFAGVGTTVSYEPDANTVKTLSYGRNKIRSMIKEIVSLSV